MGYKGVRFGGRQKGTPNKRSQEAQRLAEEIGCDPLRVLLAFVQNDWEFLGYSSATMTKVLADGGTLEVERIEPSMRLHAAKEACQYLYPKLKAIEHSGGVGDTTAVVVTLDAVKKALQKDPMAGEAPNGVESGRSGETSEISQSFGDEDSKFDRHGQGD